MAIELKDVEHLAGLARIAVSDSEKEVLRHDLEEILAYVSEIKDVAAELGEPAVGELGCGLAFYVLPSTSVHYIISVILCQYEN